MTNKDPWTDPDPQPGDFDADLAMLGPDDVDVYEGDPNARLTILGSAGDSHAERSTDSVQLVRPKRGDALG